MQTLRAVGLRLWLNQNPMKPCSNTTAGPTLQTQTQEVWVGPGICISHQLLSDADAASLGTALREPLP